MMDPTLAALIFGLAVVIVVAVVLWRAQNRDGHAEASWSFGEVFKSTVKFGPDDAASAESAIERAASQRGESSSGGPVIARTASRLARILWVDDLPDNNLFETVALEKLGRFVTKTTSTEAALIYLAEMEFALVITDLGRGRDPHAGEEFIRHLRTNGSGLPIVVYTVNATEKRQALVAAGANAVVDKPADLINEVDKRLADPEGSNSASART